MCKGLSRPGPVATGGGGGYCPISYKIKIRVFVMKVDKILVSKYNGAKGYHYE